MISTSVTFYITANGEVVPQPAPITTLDNVLYTLSDSLSYTGSQSAVVVERSNIIVDGNGLALQGSTNGNGFSLSNVTGVIIRNITIAGFNLGIAIGWEGDNITVTDNIITENNYGIYINSAWNNTIKNNRITNNHHQGVDIVHAYDKPGNIVESNLIADNDFEGIYVYDTTMNTIVKNNTVINNLNGIVLDDARGLGEPGNNVVIYNTIMNNTLGIGSYTSEGNKIYSNNMINNTVQVQSNVTYINAWDDGFKGNYWSDYPAKYPNATQTGDTWDTPYVIDANNIDNHPLVSQVAIAEFPSFLIISLFMFATILAVMVFRRKHAEISRSL